MRHATSLLGGRRRHRPAVRRTSAGIRRLFPRSDARQQQTKSVVHRILGGLFQLSLPRQCRHAVQPELQPDVRRNGKTNPI